MARYSAVLSMIHPRGIGEVFDTRFLLYGESLYAFDRRTDVSRSGVWYTHPFSHPFKKHANCFSVLL